MDTMKWAKSVLSGRCMGRTAERRGKQTGDGAGNVLGLSRRKETAARPLPPWGGRGLVARAWAGAGRGETLKSGSQVSGPQGAAGHSQSRLLVEQREEGAWRRRGALAAAAVGCGRGWSWGLRCGKSRCPPGPEEPRSGAVN